MDQKSLRVDAIKAAMQTIGINATSLAESIGVSKESVSNWLSKDSFPRPDKLLKLALKLGLSFDQLIDSFPVANFPEPKIAFRRAAQKVTTNVEVQRAKSMGDLLRPLVQFLSYNRLVKPAEFINPVKEYSYIQKVVVDLRTELKIPLSSRIEFVDLIDKFNDLKAVIVPAMWGKKSNHENALHILLPDISATWIYLNLDSSMADFKFWMAHELAHVFTPTLTGLDEGEDFADAFAAAFLYPEQCAKSSYQEIVKLPPAFQMIQIKNIAFNFIISPITVLNEINNYASQNNLPKIDLKRSIYGAAKNFQKQLPTVSEHLFDGKAPTAKEFIEESQKAFGTQFFITLSKFLTDSNEGYSYVQRVMNVPLTDAKEITECLLPKGNTNLEAVE